MSDGNIVMGTPDHVGVPMEGSEPELVTSSVTSEIVIVDDDGNVEPYDPSKL